MSVMASEITGVSIVYSIICSGADQRIHESSASLAIVRGIHRWPVNSPHTRPVTRKMLPLNEVIMSRGLPCLFKPQWVTCPVTPLTNSIWAHSCNLTNSLHHSLYSFYTCYDSWAVVVCANLGPNLMIIYHVRTGYILQDLELTACGIDPRLPDKLIGTESARNLALSSYKLVKLILARLKVRSKFVHMELQCQPLSHQYPVML